MTLRFWRKDGSDCNLAMATDSIDDLLAAARENGAVQALSAQGLYELIDGQWIQTDADKG